MFRNIYSELTFVDFEMPSGSDPELSNRMALKLNI